MEKCYRTRSTYSDRSGTSSPTLTEILRRNGNASPVNGFGSVSREADNLDGESAGQAPVNQKRDYHNPPAVKWPPPVPGRDLPDNIKDETICITSSLPIPAGSLRPLVEPLHLTKTYVVNEPDQYAHWIQNEGRWAYQRLWCRTTEAAELCLAQLEQSPGVLLYNSGVGAMTAVLLTFLQPGDHILTHEPLYSGTHAVINKFLPRFGITWSSVEAGSDAEEFRAAIQPNTKMLLVESPCNPDTSILDLASIAALGREFGILTCADGTFASPALQKVIPMGIDFSVHSCSKYIGGHVDVIAGSVAVRTEEQFKIMKMSQFAFLGSALGPFEAYQVHRGLRTLCLRMERHSKNAMLVAQALEKHRNVNWVMYPGLESHPGHEIAKRQMKAFAGMIAMEVKGGKTGAVAFTKGLRVCPLTSAVGGTETAVNNPFLFSHGPHIMSDDDRRKARVTEGLIRISVGLEDADDIIADLTQALDVITPDMEQKFQRRPSNAIKTPALSFC